MARPRSPQRVLSIRDQKSCGVQARDKKTVLSASDPERVYQVYYVIARKMLPVAVPFFGPDELLEGATYDVGRPVAE